MQFDKASWKKTFFFIWSGQAISLVGSQIVQFAIAWWITQSTGSAVVLATMAIFSMLPQVILGPFIGALVDRLNRRMVMIFSDASIAVVTVGLAALFLSGRIEYWHLYAAALARSLMGVFHWTAMNASTSLMVPKDQLARVAGLNQTLQGILTIAAPPLGALVVSLMPMGPIMLIDVVTAALAVLPLLFIRIPQPENVSAEAVSPLGLLRDVRDGFAYLRAMPGLLIVMIMATLINFFLNPTGTLTPLLVTRHFGGGAWHLSAIESAFGFGIIAGGLLLSVWGGFKRRIITSLVFLLVMGAATLLTGIAPSRLFIVAVVGSALAGITGPMVNGPLFALLQDRIAPEMQGRIFSLTISVAGAISPLGMAIAAPVADNLGIQVWWWIGGAACLLMGIVAMFIPAVVNLEQEMAHKALTEVLPTPVPAD